MTDRRRDIVVVLGMHRSGTSLAAGLLHLLGVHMGRYLVPARGDNPRGFFENQEIVEVHKRLNRSLHRRPMSLAGTLHMPDNWQQRSDVRRYRDQLREILVAEVKAAGAATLGFKDPHTARLLPMWQDLFLELDLQPRYVVCARNPAAVAESLRRRDGIRPEHAELLWVQHYLGALQIEEDAHMTVVEFEAWFEDFDAQYFALAESSRVARQVAEARLEQARGFAAPDLNHAQRVSGTTNTLASALYCGMQSFRAGRLGRPALMALVRECDATTRSFGLWSRLLGGETPALSQSWETLAGNPAVPGVRDFPMLKSRLPDQVERRKRLRICVATYELDGPVRSSGRGSEAADIAVALASAGHAVTILYVPRTFSEEQSFSCWVEHYAALGVELVGMGSQHLQSDAKWLRQYRPRERLTLCRPPAFNVYLWLRHRHFDIVHAFDTRAAVYYSLLARRLDLRHSGHNETLFHLRVAGPGKLRNVHDALPLDDVQDLGTAYMERRVVELADIVTAPAPGTLEELQHEHYALAPERVMVLPYVGCRHVIAPPPTARSITEIVFLGTLAPRNGLNLFVDAIGWLHRDPDVLPRIRFLGATSTEFPAQEYLRQRTAAWRVETILDTGRGREDALRLLAEGGRLVILTGAECHLGIAVAECLQLGVPFLAADSDANRWALGEQAPDMLFPLHPHRLADAIRARLAKPGVSPIRDTTRVVDGAAWLRWHESIAADPTRWRRKFHFQPRAADERPPLVSVCVAHFNRPHFLRQSLASIAAQTYANIEVVVVDDGSTEPGAMNFLAELESEFDRRGWRIIRQENRYLGAVRNTGAAHARGKYCLFMDDDNYAKPGEVETFVRIAEHTGAEILTCFADVFHGDEPPDPAQEGRQVITQLGDNLAMGLFRNGFGDSNCFVQRDFFLDIGGNSEDYKVGKDDQEFFARAVLNGARLYLVPEALYWYRETPVRMRSLHYNLYAGNLRVMRPYLAAVPPVLRDVLRFAQGQLVTYQKHLGRQRFQRKAVMEVLESESWRMAKPLRTLARRLRGKGAAEITEEQVESSPDPGLLLASLYASVSWQVTGPWRLFRRTTAGLVRVWNGIRKWR